MALSAANAVAYLLASNDLITVNGQSQGIAAILVVGAATDYGLLLVARYREELRRHPRNTRPWGRLAPVGRAHRGLGGHGDPGRALPASLRPGLQPRPGPDLGRQRRLRRRGRPDLPAGGPHPAGAGRVLALPAHPGSEAPEQAGLWGRVAGLIRRRPAPVLAATLAVLLAAAAFLPTLKADGIALADTIRGRSQAVDGSAAGLPLRRRRGSPAVIITWANSAEEVTRAAAAVDGVARVLPVTDTGPGGPVGPPGRRPHRRPSRAQGGRRAGRAERHLQDPADSDAAIVGQLRRAVRTADPRAWSAGPPPPTWTPARPTSATGGDHPRRPGRNHRHARPAAALLVAPLLLTATVVLSFAATLGIAALAFNQLFDFPGSDPGVVLIGFVFLIALGVDYNIFLLSRAREESLQVGTREGILRALAVTGGVITSAGLVLAATFGALVVLPC